MQPDRPTSATNDVDDAARPDAAAYEADVVEHLTRAGFGDVLTDEERTLVRTRAGEGTPAPVVALELEALRPHVNAMAPVDRDQPTGYGSLD